MWPEAAAGLALGLSLAAPPGPMNALIAREAARHGVLPAVRVGVAAPIADVLFLALLWFGLRPLVADPVLRVAAGIGAALMLVFAIQTARATEAAAPRRATFVGAFAMALTNPYQVGWWLSGGFALIVGLGAAGILGLVVGIFAWVVAFAWLTSRGQRWPWFRPLVDVLAADVLLVFALLLAWVALT